MSIAPVRVPTIRTPVDGPASGQQGADQSAGSHIGAGQGATPSTDRNADPVQRSGGAHLGARRCLALPPSNLTTVPPGLSPPTTGECGWGREARRDSSKGWGEGKAKGRGKRGSDQRRSRREIERDRKFEVLNEWKKYQRECSIEQGREEFAGAKGGNSAAVCGRRRRRPTAPNTARPHRQGLLMVWSASGGRLDRGSPGEAPSRSLEGPGPMSEAAPLHLPRSCSQPPRRPGRHARCALFTAELGLKGQL